MRIWRKDRAGVTERKGETTVDLAKAEKAALVAEDPAAVNLAKVAKEALAVRADLDKVVKAAVDLAAAVKVAKEAQADRVEKAKVVVLAVKAARARDPMAAMVKKARAVADKEICPILSLARKVKRRLPSSRTTAKKAAEADATKAPFHGSSGRATSSSGLAKSLTTLSSLLCSSTGTPPSLSSSNLTRSRKNSVLAIPSRHCSSTEQSIPTMV